MSSFSFAPRGRTSSKDPRRRPLFEQPRRSASLSRDVSSRSRARRIEDLNSAELQSLRSAIHGRSRLQNNLVALLVLRRPRCSTKVVTSRLSCQPMIYCREKPSFDKCEVIRVPPLNNATTQKSSFVLRSPDENNDRHPRQDKLHLAIRKRQTTKSCHR